MYDQGNNENARFSSEASGEADRLLVVSIGVHTRLGDVLELALAETPFETIVAEELLAGHWLRRRLLFAISAEESGENTLLRALAANLCAGALEGCVCASIVDGASGGEAHLDTLRLLRAANAAGARISAKPLLESGRELRQFALGRETPFARYCARAGELVARLMAAETNANQAGFASWRFLTTLETGISRDWRIAIARYTDLCEDTPNGEDFARQTILICENATGLPDETTLALLNDSGELRILLASPEADSEFYLSCLLERAVLRGNYALPPHAVLVFEGLSAVEALSSKGEMERVKVFLFE